MTAILLDHEARRQFGHGMFNSGEEPAKISVKWSEVGVAVIRATLSPQATDIERGHH